MATIKKLSADIEYHLDEQIKVHKKIEQAIKDYPESEFFKRNLAESFGRIQAYNHIISLTK